ncbi:glycosyltransferase [Metabacillus litoralis]|uniref:glycosyltransferase n=1 Tax=Metabacillus litoralis TaxID=152268 RepID=UPI00203BBB9E|nr:glycosyltransferase [Metabacillus litoralis]MCM3162333.1 methyltransferase domain-containing protein [Metabacillus litoralis]
MGQEHLLKFEKLKGQLRNLIESGQYHIAEEVMNNFNSTMKKDPEIYSMRAVIAIIHENYDKAEKMLLEGTREHGNYPDLIYNLGYIYEMKQDYQQAFENYYEAEKEFLDLDKKEAAHNAMKRIRENVPDIKKRRKVTFFVKDGMDSFLGDIINSLSEEYQTKKVIVTDFNLLEKEMENTDICWFEWCDELVIYGSNLSIAKNKHIICRLHSYEAFMPYINQVKWTSIDKVIFVAKHIQEFVLKSEKNLMENKTVVIPNGIDLKKYKLEERTKGFNIAYVGYINYKKGPMLLIQAIKAIVEQDSRYKLYIAGEFQDARYLLYFQQMIKELNLEKNVIFQGWQEDIDIWLKDKHYIISTSVLEGHPVGIMEAMARGLKPIIHNFVGARNIYPSEFLWNTLTECTKIVENQDYNPNRYRDFIEKNFSLNSQIDHIKNLVGSFRIESNISPDTRGVSILENNKIEEKEVEQFYDQFLDYLKSDRSRENPRHTYLKNRLKGLLKPSDTVLDLGCGIGITTEYIKTLGVKEVLGVDLSPKLIEYARETVKNVEFLVHDITRLELGKKYDVITLCDVMEHVPREKYEELFNVIKNHLKEDGKVFISIPDPQYLDFIREIMPEKLQIIDNSITMDEMNKLCSNSNLKISLFNVYSIFIQNEYNEYILVNSESYVHSWEALVK